MDQTKKIILVASAAILTVGGVVLAKGYVSPEAADETDQAVADEAGQSPDAPAAAGDHAPANTPSNAAQTESPQSPDRETIHAGPLLPTQAVPMGAYVPPGVSVSPSAPAGRILASPEQIKLMQESNSPPLPPPPAANSVPPVLGPDGQPLPGQPPAEPNAADADLYKPLPGQQDAATPSTAPQGTGQNAVSAPLPSPAPAEGEIGTSDTATAPAPATATDSAASSDAKASDGTTPAAASASAPEPMRSSPTTHAPMATAPTVRPGEVPVFDAITGKQTNAPAGAPAYQPPVFDAVSGKQINGDPNAKPYQPPVIDAVTGTQLNAKQNAANGYQPYVPLKRDAVTGKEIGAVVGDNPGGPQEKPQSLRDEMRSKMQSNVGQK